MRPRMSKKDLRASSPTPRSTSRRSGTLVSGPKHREILAKHAKIPPLVLLPHDESLVQNQYLRRLPGQVGFLFGKPESEDGSSMQDDAGSRREQLERQCQDKDNPFILDECSNRIDSPISRYRRKKEKQWERWQVDVIPRLIIPYMKLMCNTKSLRESVLPGSTRGCTCGSSRRQLDVTLVCFDCELWLYL